MTHNVEALAMAGQLLKSRPQPLLIEDILLKIRTKSSMDKGRVGKGISAQASHKSVRETLASYGFSHSAEEDSYT